MKRETSSEHTSKIQDMARRNEYVIYNVANVRTYVHIYIRTGLSDKANGVQKPKIKLFL